MIILLLVLLLALLVPAVYRSGHGNNINPELDQQTAESQSVQSDSGDKSAPPSGVQTNIGEKAAVPDKQPDSNSGCSTSNNTTGITPGANSGDPAQSSADTRVAIAVVGKNGEILFGPADVKLAPDKPVNALSVLAATGLPYIISTRFPDLVISVAGQQNLGQSGWMYKVNNEIASVAASKKPVSAGDRVIWWYSQSLDAPSPEWGSLLK